MDWAVFRVQADAYWADIDGHGSCFDNGAFLFSNAAFNCDDKVIEFMLEVMRNEENELATRLDAAVKAAPYVHPKLAAIDHSHSGAHAGSQGVYLISDHPMTEEEWVRACVREG